MIGYRAADITAGSDDRAFVVANWSSSYKSSHQAGMITSEDWATVMHAQIGKVLERPTTKTIVRADGDFLFGFISGDLSGPVPIVHYVYVKVHFRKEGLARGLFGALGVDPAAPFLFTCRTPIVSRIEGHQRGAFAASKIPRSRFVPAAARYTDYRHRGDPTE